MRRFSVSSLMIVVLICAVSLTAVRNANELWAGILLLLTLGIALVALLGIIYRQDNDRAWWVGFALFEGSYLALAFGPWFADQIEPNLPTTLLLNYVHSKVTSSPFPQKTSLQNLHNQRMSLLRRFANVQRSVRFQTDPVLVSISGQLVDLDQRILAIQGFPPTPESPVSPAATAPAPSQNRWQNLLPGARNYEQFSRVGHCLFALLAGLAGAILSCRFYSRRERRGEPQVLPPFDDWPQPPPHITTAR
jgi:hypothetical protein